MYTVQYGGKDGASYSLVTSDALLAVRTVSRETALGPVQESAPLNAASHDAIQEFERVHSFPAAGVEIYRARKTRAAKATRDAARNTLKKDPEVEFAGRVLIDPKSHSPVLYTENAFVKFADDARSAQIKQILKKYKFSARRMLGYARNAYVISAPANCGLDVFELVGRLFEDGAVELLHPELIRRAERKTVAFPAQWHLAKRTIGGKAVDAHASVEAAWSLADGSGVTIAIIDDGVDIDHEEFRANGKVLAPRDVTDGGDDPRPHSGGRHGTAVAGVACADGNFGAAGVAPRARLIPIRLASGLGSQAEADAFAYAAQQGADVISCSWGPEDGNWNDPADPLHSAVVPLPDSTRLAIDFAATQGRNGKGCVVLFAAGNGNEPVENDGYASHANVIAVAACNDSGKRSAYSDKGAAVWCAFPSNETVDPRLTPGIWTTDNSGASGYNPGSTTKGDAKGNYTNNFGGTSSAAPGAAGVAALILSRNPTLRGVEVREIMKQCCDQIDRAGGNYDASGHSPLYGYGRLNARKAVELALPAQPPQTHVVTASVKKDVAIRDFKTATLTVTVAEGAPLKALTVEIDIEHTYIGDLLITLNPPPALRLAPILLHNNAGGGTDNLHAKYDAVSLSALKALTGKSPAGVWTLLVKDTARGDIGRVRALTLAMTV